MVAAGAALAPLLAACSAPDSFRVITRQGLEIQNLFVFEMVLSAFVFLLVVGILVYVLLHYRGRPGDGEPPQVHGNRTIEIIWTATPFAIVTLLFVLSLLTMRVVRASSPPDALTVRVIGHQWWWEYQYPALHIDTADELHLPVGTPVHLEIQSTDVIHSFWVPQFGWKLDAIPGRTNVMDVQVNDVGTYQGACTQFCGNQHAWMRTLVMAQPAADFQTWVGQQQAAAPAPSAEAARGRDVFMSTTCASCHTIAGTPAQGKVGPDLTHLGSRQTLGGGVLTNTPANLQRWISNAQQVKPGILMPNFKLSDADLKAVVAYLEGLK